MNERARNAGSRSMLDKLHRQLRYRLVVPILRGKQSPEYIARGVAIGIALALTPLVGVQIPLVLLCWIIVKRYFRDWDFHLPIAIAWTFLTNVFTLPFFYYAFLVTGRVLLGRWDRIRDFETFSGRLGKVSPADSGWIGSLFDYITGLFIEFGWPMFIGSLPWAVIGTFVGYRWSLRLVVTFRHRRTRRDH